MEGKLKYVLEGRLKWAGWEVKLVDGKVQMGWMEVKVGWRAV